MIFKKMLKFLKIIIFIFISTPLYALNTNNFNLWLNDFKVQAKKEGISQETISVTLDNSIYLPKVIEYDRFQPEFYEDTKTYINKRVTKLKIKRGLALKKKDLNLLDEIENKFEVEKELLIALMGIETNFGKYLGKMDIISSLATLSFDKRRSEFFSNELMTLLKLVDKKIIDHKILFGSWAGAFGNFQFMPSTIKNYAIDYDKNNIIELKKKIDSYASAANYINKIGWKKNEPCFYKVELTDDIPKFLLNTSAKKIENKTKVANLKKYIKGINTDNLDDELYAGIITPDKDIVPNSKNLSPAYLVFNNYELILKWNRSLRFALAVCSLKENLKNEI